MNEEEILKQKKRRRSYLKLNILSLFFTAVSFISVTLAWFAYSGLVTTQTEVNVKAWFIEFNNKGNAVSNDIVISLDDIYPGMDIMSETIDIKNSGDSDAKISYKIKSVRILEQEFEVDENGIIEDKLSHEFPFHINMSLSKNYANAHDGTGSFVVSVSWPLDSDNDDFDTEWGVRAYEFQSNEAEKLSNDSNYQVRSTIEVKISLEAEQYIGEGNEPDPNYILGGIQLYDVVNNTTCTEMSSTCLKTYIIDTNNKLSDSSVTLLPDLYGTYVSGSYSDFDTLYNGLTSTWTVSHRRLSANDILPIVSKDVNSTVLIGDEISNQLIGYLNYGNRVDSTIDETIQYNGYIRFKHGLFSYFTTSSCYWIDESYDTDKQFALVKVDNMFSKIYGENKTSSCKVVPVIEVSKSNLNNESSN